MSGKGFGRYLTDEYRDRTPKAGDIVDGVTIVENPDYVAPTPRSRPGRPTRPAPLAEPHDARPPRSGSYANRDRGFGRHLPDDGPTDR